jgi:hypothetical protein
MLAWARDATDFRPSMNGVGGAFASGRTVCKSSREPWRDGAGSLPDLRISAPSGFARILVWAGDATDFRPSINGGATVPVARKGCERVGERWRIGAGGLPSLRSRSHRCLHAYGRGVTDATWLGVMMLGVWIGLLCHFTHNVHLNGQDHGRGLDLLPCHIASSEWARATEYPGPLPRFSTIEKRRCDCAGGRAQAASMSVMAHRRRRFADFRDSVNSHCNLHPLHALTNATLISARE